MSARSRGFFVLSRGWRECPVLQDHRPMTRAEAWAWIIERTAFTETAFRTPAGKIVPVARGQLSTSYDQLASAWRWTKSEAEKFLHKLAAHDMLRIGKAGGQSLLTIVNYDRHQVRAESDRFGTESGRDRDPARDGQLLENAEEIGDAGTPLGTESGRLRDPKEVSTKKEVKDSVLSRGCERAESPEAAERGRVERDRRQLGTLPPGLQIIPLPCPEAILIDQAYSQISAERCKALRPPSVTGQHEAKKWIKDGAASGLDAATVARLAVDVIHRICDQRALANEEPPNGLAYYRPAIKNEIAEFLRPGKKIQPAAGPRASSATSRPKTAAELLAERWA